ncbi:hypothetical protein N5J77_11655 [Sphingobium yanoikuyae]|uniref:Uncharacterized protein n=1 Tax=Sphingobium yanoikuyae TaxID=13690 RepID=A0AA42WU13_SPHYA|nr:hypothetical protein [Sphingobium yanoikuyae]MDH2131780.1 hypothetical protein [Sphingobium yanoikuyae]MDH2151928.1 hypothetical protein [Sphingobium yanoikuyae]MDH2166937.1 hypothetical protein [Sphingobium yanoikuyae]
MAEFNEEDAKEASQIVEGLLEGGFRTPRAAEGISIVDVEAHAREFNEDLSVLERIGESVPCLPLADVGPVPLSLGEFAFRLPFDRLSRPFPRDFIYDRFAYRMRRLREERDEIVFQSPSEARSTFLRNAANFLANRIASVRQWREHRADAGMHATLSMAQYLGGARMTVPGCAFEVTTDTDHLNVYWSGAYYIVSNYFGHPTSPAKGTLQSGTYVFGVKGGAYGSAVQWDTASVVTLPGRPAVHLQY